MKRAHDDQSADLKYVKLNSENRIIPFEDF